MTTTATQTGTPETQSRRSRRLREVFVAQLRFAAPALAGYALVRAIGLAVLFVFAYRVDRPVTALLSRYDGGWYLGIAENGYDTSITYDEDGLKNTNVAFFPLFPLLIRVVAATGLSPVSAGLVLAFLGGLAAAWGIFAVGARIADRQLGIMLAVLWGVIPHAIVQNMVYAETLFTAFCAWSLCAVLDRRWITAGVLACGAGLTRPSAAALVAALAVVCLVQLINRRDGWRPLAAAAIAPLGMIGYWAWCAIALGRPDAWFWMQREGWGTKLDFGRDTVRMLKAVSTHEPSLGFYVTTLVVAVAALLLALLILGRQAPWPLVLFAGTVLALTVMQGGFYHVKARFLIGAFPLLIPVAAALVRTKPHARYLVLALLTGVSAWYGTYLLLLFGLSP